MPSAVLSTFNVYIYLIFAIISLSRDRFHAFFLNLKTKQIARSVLSEVMYLERPKIQIWYLLCDLDTTTSCRLWFRDESQHGRLEAQKYRKLQKSGTGLKRWRKLPLETSRILAI